MKTALVLVLAGGDVAAGSYIVSKRDAARPGRVPPPNHRKNLVADLKEANAAAFHESRKDLVHMITRLEPPPR